MTICSDEMISHVPHLLFALTVSQLLPKQSLCAERVETFPVESEDILSGRPR